MLTSFEMIDSPLTGCRDPAARRYRYRRRRRREKPARFLQEPTAISAGLDWTQAGERRTL